MKKSILCSAIALAATMANANVTDDSWTYMLGEQNAYPAPTSFEMLDAPEGYEFVSMTQFSRHGSRYALNPEHLPNLLESFKAIAEKGELTQEGKNLLADVEQFAQWWGNNTDRLGYSTDLGFEEFEAMGRRAVQMASLKEHDKTMGDPLVIVSKSSGKVRTLESEVAYLHGAGLEAAKTRTPLLIQSDNSIESRSVTDPHDYYGFHTKYRPLGKPIKAELFAENDANAPEAVSEFVDQLITGLDREDAIDMVNIMFELCRQDAPQGQIQGMCKPFAQWAEDGKDDALFDWFFVRNQIDKFYMFGPAELYDGISTAMGNPIINEFVDSIDLAVNKPDEAPVLDVRFGHDAGVIALLSAVGIMKSDGSDKERFAAFKPYSQFPMGSNVIWQLYRNDQDYKVRMLHNERPVSFPIAGCEDSELCSWDTVKAHYSQPQFQVSYLEDHDSGGTHREQFAD